MTQPRAQTFQLSTDAAAEDSVAQVLAGWRSRRPDLNVDAIGITARVARLHTLVAPRQAAVIERFGLRTADFALLASLVRLAGEDVSQRRLGAELGLSAATVSLRIDRLVGRGLVDRRPDPEDGRGALISITEPGAELFEACVPEHLAASQALVAALSEEEREELGRLLGKLLHSLEEEQGDDAAATGLGLVVDGAPIAVERRRAVGLPPIPGLLVAHVDPAGPAAAAGIRRGDLLTAAGRRPLRSPHDLRLAMSQPAGRRRTVALEVVRGADAMRIVLPLPAR
jgi:DNA-binding MarR family transcriptional regulator